MYLTLQVFILLPLFLSAAIAFPKQTGTVTAYTIPAIITPAVALRCSDGQLAIYTTDCTLGIPVSYCSRPGLQSNAQRVSSRQSGIQTTAWNSQPVSRLMQRGSRLSVRMVRLLMLRQPYTRVRLLEDSRLS
jgi:hypothetical protein